MESARQIAALPVRREADGSLLVLLVTSRDRRRSVVIPKGWPWPNREDCVAAAEEAREEAGVLGHAHAKNIGVYTYCKRRPTGSVEVCVTAYPLEVTEELASWPEGDQRQRSWFTPIDAAAAVEEPELQRLLRHLASGADALR